MAVALAILSPIASGIAVGGQSQTPPVFRAEAALVEIIVGVRDQQGRVVAGLRPADFEVRDEGRLQTIVAFDDRVLQRPPALPRGSGRVPLDRPDMSTVATNEDAGESRLFVFFLDDLGTPPSHLLSVRRSARDVLERYVTALDLVAVFPTSGRGVMTQEFTRDKTRVLAAVDHFVGSGADFGPYASRVRADVAEAIARHLRDIRGRRVSLVWFSANALDESEFYGRRALDALREANVTVYVVDPRKLYVRDVAEMTILGGGMAAGVQQAVPRWGERPYGTRPDVLRDFAEKTGGFAAVNTNDFDEAYDRILEENSRYYVLGFSAKSSGARRPVTTTSGTGSISTGCVGLGTNPLLAATRGPAGVPPGPGDTCPRRWARWQPSGGGASASPACHRSSGRSGAAIGGCRRRGGWSGSDLP